MYLMSVFLYSFASVFAVSLISLVGITTLSMRAETLKKVLLYLVSFAAGSLLGDAFIHLLPEIVEETGSWSLHMSFYVMSGIITFFVLEKIINWHHYHLPHTKEQVHPFVITNLIGDGFHNFIDGLIIAASYLVSVPVGLATTLAVILHEIPQEIGDFSVLLHGGFSKRKALLFNFLTALIAVFGALLAFALNARIDGMISI